MTWAATQAKAKFSEVLDKAEAEGPQLVRRRKRDFYVVTKEAFEASAHSAKHSSKAEAENIADFFRNSPLRGSGIRLERVKLTPRHVDF